MLPVCVFFGGLGRVLFPFCFVLGTWGIVHVVYLWFCVCFFLIGFADMV